MFAKYRPHNRHCVSACPPCNADTLPFDHDLLKKGVVDTLMRKLALDLKCLKIKDGLSQSYYRKEARHVMRRLGRSDKNFRYFFMEFISLAKENVDVEALRETISELQKYVCLRINQEHRTESGPDIIRHKVKYSKKNHFGRFDNAY